MSAWAEAEYIIESVTEHFKKMFGGNKLVYIGSYEGNQTIDISLYQRINPLITADDFIIVPTEMYRADDASLQPPNGSSHMVNGFVPGQKICTKEISGSNLIVTNGFYRLQIGQGVSANFKWDLYI